MVVDSSAVTLLVVQRTENRDAQYKKKRKKKTKYQDKPDKVPLVPQHSQAKGEETSPHQGLEQANIYSEKNTKLILRMRNLRSGDYREHRTAVSTLLGLISRAYPCFSIKLELVISNCRDGGRQFGSNSACGAENRKSRCAVSKKKKKKTKYQDKPDKVPLVPQHSQAKGEETSPHQGLEQANI